MMQLYKDWRVIYDTYHILFGQKVEYNDVFFDRYNKLSDGEKKELKLLINEHIKEIEKEYLIISLN